MPRFKTLGVIVGLTIALLALQATAAGAVPSGATKTRPDSGLIKLLPHVSPGTLAPSGVTASAESEPNNYPSIADPISNGLDQEGSLDWDTDSDDVYSITLNPGDELEVRMIHNWSAGEEFADLDLYLYGPGTDDDWFPLEIDKSESWGINVEFMRYKVPPTGGGTYYIDVYAWDTLGPVAYWLDVSVNDAVDTSGVRRLSGESRYDTAVDISRRTFPEGGCDTVVLATGANFPDALSASGLAGVYGGPLLLTQKYAVPGSVYEELDRLGATDIIIVGGTGAVSDTVKTMLEMEGYSVTRIWGLTRYETAALVADEVLTAFGSDTVFVVRGDSFPDALAAAPFAYEQGIPILLTPTAYLDAETESVIDFYDIQTAIIAGGTSAVSSATEDEIAALNGGAVVTDRQDGESRYETAAMLAHNLVNDYGYNSFAMVGVATGRSFPDALAGGAAMGYEGGVLLLSPGDALDPWAALAIDFNMVAGDDINVFGGEAAIETGGTLFDLWSIIP